MNDPRSQVDFTPALGQLRLKKLEERGQVNVTAPATCPKDQWPPDYVGVAAWRERTLARLELNPASIPSARAYYANGVDGCIRFINHWCDTYDPRNISLGKPARFPLILFPRQEELVRFVLACIFGEAGGLIEKSRDMGATWVCAAITVWLWLFWPGAAIGWGSNKQEQVDKLGDPNSIFEKIRMLIRGLPDFLKPDGFDESKHLFYMRCLNLPNGSTISGELGDNIGRGGRTLVYFVDEAAHLERPEAVEAALSENTRVRIDISSVSGLGTVFWRKRQAGVDWVPDKPVIKFKTNVFVLDWSDHPLKTGTWHQQRKEFFENAGMAHVFARETERDYAGAAEGVIIPAAWVQSALDAHLRIPGFDQTGAWFAGLDVADQGLDTNALAKRQGSILRLVDEWGERDTGRTTRRAVAACEDTLPLNLQYDAIGVGAGVKAEANRLRDEGLLPKGLILTPWFASAQPLDPFDRVVDGDPQSPINKNFYYNLKAQAWWSLRRRFELTHRCITEPGFTAPSDNLISLPSTLPLIRKLQTELSQPIITRDTRTMKLVVDKTPEGTKSPNLGDAVCMSFFPWHDIDEPLVGIYGPIVLRPNR